MAVTVAPAVEAMTAIRDRINSGTAYVLAANAEYSELQVDERESLDELRVDVVSEDEKQLSRLLSSRDSTSHKIRVWIRSPIERGTNEEIDPLKLLVEQVFERVDNWDSSDRRVRVWECNPDPKKNPDKELLRTQQLFVSSILLIVKVEPS